VDNVRHGRAAAVSKESLGAVAAVQALASRAILAKEWEQGPELLCHAFVVLGARDHPARPFVVGVGCHAEHALADRQRGVIAAALPDRPLRNLAPCRPRSG
jgi:hypothetical protein